MLQQLQGLLMTMRLWDILDILVVAFFLYRIYLLIRNTRATALVKGLLLLGALTLVTGWLRLHALAWILDKLMAVLIVALPIVFQPELRRALEQIGRCPSCFSRSFAGRWSRLGAGNSSGRMRWWRKRIVAK